MRFKNKTYDDEVWVNYNLSQHDKQYERWLENRQKKRKEKIRAMVIMSKRLQHERFMRGLNSLPLD